MQLLKGILFFKATNTTKANNLSAAGWVLQGCVHETDVVSLVKVRLVYAS